ncbi:MAG: hypothetical protein ACRCT8_00430 [Lacipirellulaceae bacterium]
MFAVGSLDDVTFLIQSDPGAFGKSVQVFEVKAPGRVHRGDLFHIPNTDPAGWNFDAYWRAEPSANPRFEYVLELPVTVGTKLR